MLASEVLESERREVEEEEQARRCGLKGEESCWAARRRASWLETLSMFTGGHSCSSRDSCQIIRVLYNSCSQNCYLIFTRKKGNLNFWVPEISGSDTRSTAKSLSLTLDNK